MREKEVESNEGYVDLVDMKSDDSDDNELP